MTEPIYKLGDGWNPNVILAATGEMRATAYGNGCAGQADHRRRAEYLCRLLNENPLPEDLPKKYAVNYAGHPNSWVYVVERDTANGVAAFNPPAHPGARAAAQAECDRLNALEGQ